jgi:DNA polymerase delta subunit 1
MFLHDKLCTEVNMRQSGALLRTCIETQADCGMQRLLLNMMYAELERDYIINRFLKDVFSYEGAVVIEPITGFYTDPVLTMDYQSLYPSIMIAGNICPSTMLQKRRDKKRPKPPDGVLVKTWVSDEATGQEASFVQNRKGSSAFGVIPLMLKRLLAARRAVQKLMKTAHGFEYLLLNALQLAIKVCCNSVCVTLFPPITLTDACRLPVRVHP